MDVLMQIMDNLLLGVGDLVNLQNVSLPKGTFIKIQPHTSDFLDISNPKAVLETSLRSFTCLTEVRYQLDKHHCALCPKVCPIVQVVATISAFVGLTGLVRT
jgi:hypothetical protein